MYKPLITLFLLFCAKIAFSQNDYLQNGSIGTVKPEPKKQSPGKLLYGPLPYRELQETVGEYYICMPPSEGQSQGTYPLFEKIGSSTELTQKDLAGRILKLENYKEELIRDQLKHVGYFSDSTGAKYKYVVTDNEFAYMLPLSDIDNARKMFLNKTLWMNAKYILTGDPASNNVGGRIQNLRFQPVTVIDIKLGYVNNLPIVFVLKTAKGEIGFKETIVSGTNSFSFPMFENFSAKFFEKDPRQTYKLTPKVWQMVLDGNVQIGMPSDAVALILGNPTAVNSIKTAKTFRTQWVYGTSSPSYYYFQNDKLVSISR